MLGIKTNLLRHLLERSMVLVVIVAFAASFWVLVRPEVFEWRDLGPAFAIALVVARLAHTQNRLGSGGIGFLYTRGYSRACLWGHIMLAGAVAIVIAWLPAALMVWTSLRSIVQDRIFRSPYFPVMAPLETYIPWFWLAIAVVFTSLWHYARIRWRQPTRGGAGATVMVVAMYFVMLTIQSEWRARHPGARIVMWVCIAAVCGVAWIASRRFHQTQEVRD